MSLAQLSTFSFSLLASLSWRNTFNRRGRREDAKNFYPTHSHSGDLVIQVGTCHLPNRQLLTFHFQLPFRGEIHLTAQNAANAKKTQRIAATCETRIATNRALEIILIFFSLEMHFTRVCYVTLLIISVSILISCNASRSVITLVDVGNYGRIGIGKELKIINKYNPKVVAFNFILDHDSLHVDSILVNEMSKTRNLVTCKEVKGYMDFLNSWLVLQGSDPKFDTEFFGFSNISITDDSVLIPELPMRQLCMRTTVPSLSYAIADRSFGVKNKYNGNEMGDFIFKRKRFGSFFKVIGLHDLLTENFNASDLKNKIVIIGFVSTEALFYLDSKWTKTITGTELQACFVSEILNARFGRKPTEPFVSRQ
jgi:hypothetical protein